MPYSPIVATLIYVLSPDKRQVLLIHRNARADDTHIGKYNGLGGKLDSQEDIVSGAKRELFEEAGVEALSMQLRGTINWPGFGKLGEDWLGFVFVVDKFQGTPQPSNPEGTLIWVDIDKIESLPLWDGDRHFLPLVFSKRAGQFHGVMPYFEGKALSWSHTWL